MSATADRPEVTAADMVAAAERIAARDGITVEDVRERLREVDRAEAYADERTEPNAAPSVLRTCALDECDETFVPKTSRHRFCTPRHRAAGHRRVRTGGAS